MKIFIGSLHRTRVISQSYTWELPGDPGIAQVSLAWADVDPLHTFCTAYIAAYEYRDENRNKHWVSFTQTGTYIDIYKMTSSIGNRDLLSVTFEMDGGSPSIATATVICIPGGNFGRYP